MSDSDRGSDSETEVRKKVSKKAKTAHGEEPKKKKTAARRSKYVAAEDEEMPSAPPAEESLPALALAAGVKEKKKSKKQDDAASEAAAASAAEPVPVEQEEEKKEPSPKIKKNNKQTKDVSSDEEEEEKKEKPKASKKRKAEAPSSDEDDKDSSDSDSVSGSGSDSDASKSSSDSDAEEEKKPSKEAAKPSAGKENPDKKQEKEKEKEKKKKKGSKKGSSSDDSDSDGDSDSSSSEAEDDGLMTTYTPGASKGPTLDIPKGTNFLNPNNTLKFHSVKYNLNVHYTQIDPTKHLKIHESKPKTGFTNVFYAITSLKQQKFCFSGSGVHLKPAFDRALVVAPFSVVKYPRMWPYGDRDPTPGQTYAPPNHPSKIKFKLPLHNDEYSPDLSEQKKDVGSVDPDTDKFMSQWVRRKFDLWKEEAAWKCAAKQFPNALKIATAKIAEMEEKAQADYQEAKKKYKNDKKKYKKELKKNPNAKKPSEPSKPKTKTGEKALKAAFLARFDRSIVSKDEKGFDHINYSHPLFRTQTKKERDTNVQPRLHNDPYFTQQFFHPPDWEDKQKKEMKKGFPLVPIDIPMLRAITLDEALEMKKQGKEWQDPYRLVPLKDRFIINDDVVAPVIMFDKYDTPIGTGWRYEVVAVIWLGEKGALNEAAAARAPSYKELDPTSYFLPAQKYTRTAGTFDPVTVESSRFSRAREAAASAAAAASGESAGYGYVPSGVVDAANAAYQNGEYSGFVSNGAEQPDEHGIYPSDVQ